MILDNITEDDLRYFQEKYEHNLKRGVEVAEKSRRQLELAKQAHAELMKKVTENANR